MNTIESGFAEAAPALDTDPHLLLDAMRLWRADRFDPARFRFIETLAARAAAHAGGVRTLLDRSLADALAEYAERFDRAERAASEALAGGTARFPAAADELRQYYDAGDFGGLQRALVKLEVAGAGGGPLAELLAHIGRHSSEGADGEPSQAAPGTLAPRGELKSARVFRRTWAKLSADRQLSHAFTQAPDNAGPLNSHFLALQALKLMRDTAPAYLGQFMSYVDALLWLDRIESPRNPAQKTAAGGERGRKRRAGRGKSG